MGTFEYYAKCIVIKDKLLTDGQTHCGFDLEHWCKGLAESQVIASPLASLLVVNRHHF